MVNCQQLQGWKMLTRWLLLSCAFLICSGAVVAVKSAERDVIISDAINEAKLHAATKNRDVERTKVLRTPRDLLFEFKRGSAKALAQGRASLLFEDAIRRAEKKLLKAERQAARASAAEVRAEELAKELLHRTGSLLTKQEIAKIYQDSSCGEVVQSPDCSSSVVLRQRTADGTCNNLKNPAFGAAVTPLRRIIVPEYEDGLSQLRGTMQSQDTRLLGHGAFSPPNPSPRLVSLNVVLDRQEMNDDLAHILMQWGQFIDHDVGISPILEVECPGCTFNDVCVPIPVPQDDQIFGNSTTSAQECHPFMRSAPACPDSDIPAGTVPPRQQINDITSFIDGSMVYGSSSERMESLRDPNSGRLRTGPSIPANGKPSLPSDASGFLAGDVRVNEQTGLTVMHTIWMREHNRIADKLQALNPQWDREEVFQTARKIVGAEIQKITYKDYLPLLLGQSSFNELIGNYTGYNDAINPGVPNGFTTAAYRFGHSQIRPTFDRLNENYDPIDAGPLNLVDAFFNPSQYTASGGTDPILRGLVSNSAQRIDEFLNDVLTNHLFQAGSSPGLDLASLNIQRGRDHGLPPYMVWKRWAQRTCDISSDFENQLTSIRLLETYSSLETVDLWVGGLAEERLPGSLMGATFACIIANAFAALQDGDRFYYENNDQTALFSAEQRVEIEKTSLSRIICDNADNIQEIQPNAFLLGSRTNCSAIPEVDLRAWQVSSPVGPLPDTCYLQISCTGQSSVQRTFFSFSRHVSSSEALLTDQETKSSTQGSVCLAFRCPIVGVSTRLSVIGPSGCSVTPDQNLPSNREDFMNTRTYTADLSEAVVSTANGIYTSKSDCQSGSGSALQYSCSRVELLNQNELLHELEEAVAQQNSKEGTEAYVSLSDPQIPDYIRHLFESRDNGQHKDTGDKDKLLTVMEEYVLHGLKEEANNQKSTVPNGDRREKSDAQLISELEEALHHT